MTHPDEAQTNPQALVEASGCRAVSDDAIRHLEIRSQLNRVIYRAVRNYHMTNMADEDGDPFPLVDLMSNPPPSDIGTGEMEMIALVDEIEAAVEALSLARKQIAENS